MLLGQAFIVKANLGIGGQTTTQILARINDVLALAPSWVHLVAGTNDVGSGIATTKTNITTMLDTFAANGVKVIIGTIPPHAGSYTDTQKADTFALNDWIRLLGRTRPDIVVVDYFAALADGVNGNYLATVYGANPTSDGVHLSATGAYAAGKALANALRYRVNRSVPFSMPAPGQNLIGTPRPGLSGGGASAPAGWTVGGASSGTAVWSDVARADGYGTWKQVVVPADGILTINANFTLDTTRLAVGDYVNGIVEFDVDAMQAAPSNGKQISLAVKAWNGSSYFVPGTPSITPSSPSTQGPE
jgi:lysophospholipase L1-like esterase